MKLIQLEPGQSGVVFQCEKNELPLKLMEMGCIDGEIITFLKRAPLGSPYYYKIGDSHIALSKDLAKLIDVKPLNNGKEKN